MHVNALSDVGLVRKDNEDNYLVSAERGLFVVADGMGGHLGGQLASSMAIQIIDGIIKEPSLSKEPANDLYQALIKANELILKSGRTEEYYGMGTTVTAALFYAGLLNIAHIGDSRAYLFRERELTLLTKDHSLVNELYQQGSLTLEEARNHPQRNVLTRALGTHENPKIDTLTITMSAGDMLLLCTDGLHNQVGEEDLNIILGKADSLKDKVKKMVSLALERGGSDNITVVLIQYD